MFSGIITDVGRVRAVERRQGSDAQIAIHTAYDTGAIALGASIACAGVCLTVVETGADWFAVEASAETLARTTVGSWREGTRLNLERALRMGEEIGGHMVSGHVDGVAHIAGVRPEGGSVRLEVETPEPLARFVAPKGSVALDGVSLTVNEAVGVRFGINIIEHTRRQTTLGEATAGAAVNMEVDMLARYVARMMERA